MKSVQFYTEFERERFVITNKYGQYSKRKTMKSKWVNWSTARVVFECFNPSLVCWDLLNPT